MSRSRENSGDRASGGFFSGSSSLSLSSGDKARRKKKNKGRLEDSASSSDSASQNESLAAEAAQALKTLTNYKLGTASKDKTVTCVGKLIRIRQSIRPIQIKANTTFDEISDYLVGDIYYPGNTAGKFVLLIIEELHKIVAVMRDPQNAVARLFYNTLTRESKIFDGGWFSQGSMQDSFEKLIRLFISLRPYIGDGDLETLRTLFETRIIEKSPAKRGKLTGLLNAHLPATTTTTAAQPNREPTLRITHTGIRMSDEADLPEIEDDPFHTLHQAMTDLKITGYLRNTEKRYKDAFAFLAQENRGAIPDELKTCFEEAGDLEGTENRYFIDSSNTPDDSEARTQEMMALFFRYCLQFIARNKKDDRQVLHTVANYLPAIIVHTHNRAIIIGFIQKLITEYCVDLCGPNFYHEADSTAYINARHLINLLATTVYLAIESGDLQAHTVKALVARVLNEINTNVLAVSTDTQEASREAVYITGDVTISRDTVLHLLAHNLFFVEGDTVACQTLPYIIVWSVLLGFTAQPNTQTALMTTSIHLNEQELSLIECLGYHTDDNNDHYTKTNILLTLLTETLRHDDITPILTRLVLSEKNNASLMRALCLCRPNATEAVALDDEALEHCNPSNLSALLIEQICKGHNPLRISEFIRRCKTLNITLKKRYQALSCFIQLHGRLNTNTNTILDTTTREGLTLTTPLSRFYDNFQTYVTTKNHHHQDITWTLFANVQAALLITDSPAEQRTLIAQAINTYMIALSTPTDEQFYNSGWLYDDLKITNIHAIFDALDDDTRATLQNTFLEGNPSLLNTLLARMTNTGHVKHFKVLAHYLAELFACSEVTLTPDHQTIIGALDAKKDSGEFLEMDGNEAGTWRVYPIGNTKNLFTRAGKNRLARLGTEVALDETSDPRRAAPLSPSSGVTVLGGRGSNKTSRFNQSSASVDPDAVRQAFGHGSGSGSS